MPNSTELPTLTFESKMKFAGWLAKNHDKCHQPHVQIISERNSYYLRGLGGETSINGHAVNNNVVALIPGDVVRLGRSVLFVFG